LVVPQLRGGQRSDSPLLDRIPFFDPRSRSFPVRGALEELGVDVKKPRAYTWAMDNPVLDQGDEGACVGHGFAHELAARPAVVPVNSAMAFEIYEEAQKIDEWEGGSYPGAEPFYEGTSVLAGAKVVTRMGHYSRYEWSFGLDDLIIAVGYRGPTVIGVNWYTGMFRPDSNGYIAPTGQIAGGHCVTILGVSLIRQEFLIVNSWGPSWSELLWQGKLLRGYCRITFTNMERLLQENGEAVTPVRVRL
jgi:hypothetical protein